MNLPERIAHLVVQRPRTLVALTLLLVAACVWVVVTHQRFDSDVLNLLPKDAPEVQALRVLQDDFRQGRELVFALRGDPAVVADFEAEFLEALRAEPWVKRVFAGSPLDAPEEIATLQKLVPRLLLNLPDDDFARLLTSLAPDALRQRVERLKADLAAGSPRAEMEAAVDPTGLVAQALRPIGGTAGMERGQSLASADGTVRLIPVVTTQATLSQADCSATMVQVEEFRRRILAPGRQPKPELLVTGRTPYVAQIATAMQRDVSLTSTISFAVVTGLFFVGFRRLMPPIGTTIILGLSCFVAFALGCLFFANLNMVAIAFCSILAGLGDDFSLLLYNRYLLARTQKEEHERAVATSIREVGKGILYVSLTTGAGFLALLFSGSSGFAQLGLLIAVGIVCCAVLVILLLFLFIRPRHAHTDQPDPLHQPFEALVSWLLRRRGALTVASGGLALAAFVLALWPGLPLGFDTNPRSLEPKTIPAAVALRLITEKIPAAAEPVTVLAGAGDAEKMHEIWERLEAHLSHLVKSGVLQSYSTPAALLLSPARMERHRALLLQQVDPAASGAAFAEALQAAGFKLDFFQSALELFQGLQEPVSTQFSFDETIPETSAWWFLLDRYFAVKPGLAAAYLRPAQPLRTPEEKATFEKAVQGAGVPLRITGWSYTMVGLIPWAKKELLVFSAAVGLLVLIAMAVAYRRWQPLLVHTLSLVFGLSACISLLKLTGTQINMLNALAFPLVLGVGVDYGMHVLLAMMEGRDLVEGLTTVVKPLVISGLTTIAGFGALMFAQNPALRGLGMVCALGVTCCLVSSLFMAVPLLGWLRGHTAAGREV